MINIAIIGAGLSGLSAAYLLKDVANITLFEKSRGVGGRMSTRRAEPYFFDHGAQYFTARTRPFQQFIQPLIEQGIIERWDARYVKFDNDDIIERKYWSDEEPRYVGTPGMNSIAKYLASNLNTYINTHIVSLEHKDKWQLIDREGRRYVDFDWVLSTAPSPQTLELLPDFFKHRDEIKSIDMQPCFSLMLGFTKSLSLDFEAAHVINSDVSWIAVNSDKPKREKVYTLVVQSSHDYARAHANDNKEEVMKHLIAETRWITKQDIAAADYQTIHRWLYANNAKRENSSLFIDKDHQLAAFGDWCLGGRVEGAFTSAYNLVGAIKEAVT